MAKFQIGDKVRVKDRKDWPTPPGYTLAGSEGTVIKICEWTEVLEEFQEYVKVEIEKTKADINIGSHMIFLEENLEKM
jgi:hypothetical protein